MLRATVSRISQIARTNGWWLVPQVVSIMVLSLAVGLWGLWVVYAAFNSLLVWIYADNAGPRKKRRRQVLCKVLAIPLLPIGFIASLGSGGPSASARAGDGAPGDGHRTARAFRHAPGPATGAG